MIGTLAAEAIRFADEYWLHISIVSIALILLAAILIFAIREARHRRRKKALEVWRKKQELTYRKAVEQTEEARKALEKRNGLTMVVDVIHDLTSTKGLVPFDIYPAITFDNAIDILEQLRDADPDGPVDIVLHTLGGFSLAAEIVTGALKAHRGRTTAYVPYVAMSGGTMLALACKYIVLGKNALLGPIDTQYNGYPASAYERLLKDKKENAIGDISDAYYLRAITSIDDEKDARAHVRKMLGSDVADFFLDTKVHHSSGIGFEEAASVLHGRIASNCPKEVYAFVNARLAALRSLYREAVGKNIDALIGTEVPKDEVGSHLGQMGTALHGRVVRHSVVI